LSYVLWPNSPVFVAAGTSKYPAAGFGSGTVAIAPPGRSPKLAAFVV
jgi:hypothetical protein